MQTERPGLSRN